MKISSTYVSVDHLSGEVYDPRTRNFIDKDLGIESIEKEKDHREYPSDFECFAECATKQTYTIKIRRYLVKKFGSSS